MSIFEHILPDSRVVNLIIEVVAYHPVVQKEAPHLYFLSKKLCDVLVLNQEQEVLSGSGKSIPIVLGSKHADSLIVKYLLNRLAIVHVDGEEVGGITSEFAVELFDVSSGMKEEDVEYLLLSERPEGLLPLPEIKRYRYLAVVTRLFVSCMKYISF